MAPIDSSDFSASSRVCKSSLRGFGWPAGSPSTVRKEKARLNEDGPAAMSFFKCAGTTLLKSHRHTLSTQSSVSTGFLLSMSVWMIGGK